MNVQKETAKQLDDFLTDVQILPIVGSLDLYAKEKARLRKASIRIDDFDLLIGVTSVFHNLSDAYKQYGTLSQNKWDYIGRLGKRIHLENYK